MIPRYEAPEISKLWTDQFKFEKFFAVEIALLKSLEKENIIPQNTSAFFKNIKINPERILEIEETTRHDVIAFCSSITEQVSAEHGKYFHFGVTSSDIIDTALSLQIKESLKIEISILEEVIDELKNKALITKDWLCIGRSHGMFAEPMSFGQKFLSFHQEFSRRLVDLKNFLEQEITMQLSGSVGNYTLLSTKVESAIATQLELKIEPLSTQVIPRDRIAKLLQINSLLASGIERFCVEIRHLHHSDLAELAEGFKKGQKGSSIMPHKKNPISSENLTGISRVIKSHAQIALENNVLWHERDISHSSAERLVLPDNFGLTVYALKRLKTMIQNLELYKDQIEEKVLNNSLYLSSYFMHFIIDHVPNIKREDVYRITQEVSFDHPKKSPQEFAKKLQAKLKEENIELNIPTIDSTQLRAIYLREIEQIYLRCLGT